MSVNIATMGMFQDCCGRAVGGGGAPPYRLDNEEVVRPLVLVTKVDVKTVDTINEISKNIKVTLID